MKDKINARSLSISFSWSFSSSFVLHKLYEARIDMNWLIAVLIPDLLFRSVHPLLFAKWSICSRSIFLDDLAP